MFEPARVHCPPKNTPIECCIACDNKLRILEQVPNFVPQLRKPTSIRNIIEGDPVYGYAPGMEIVRRWSDQIVLVRHDLPALNQNETDRACTILIRRRCLEVDRE